MSDDMRATLGEFRGDCTRETFRRRKHFLHVFMQQGRVLLDTDWNEQVSILLHYLRRLAADVVGPHAGTETGFAVAKAVDGGGSPQKLEFLIGDGRYYVDGILCESDDPLPFTAQRGAPFPDSAILAGGKAYLAYLDVWERHVTYVQDTTIREVALQGPDTATRGQLVTQVKLLELNLASPASDLEKRIAEMKAASPGNRPAAHRKVDAAFAARAWGETNGTLRARAALPAEADQACVISPEARYRRASNQLYRVEIHRGGPASDGKSEAATFKWSRDNASVVYPIDRWAGGDRVKLASLGRDDASRLRPDDWVEVVDDVSTLRGTPGPLHQVVAVQPDEMTVTLRIAAEDAPRYEKNDRRHPLLRRWDQRGRDGDLQKGAIPLTEGDGDDADQWIVLEDGVQVQFARATGRTYRSGDYWLVPARTATGDVEWPEELTTTGEPAMYPDGRHPIPAALPPHGIEHRYAPLAAVTLDGDGGIADPIVDLRHVVTPLALL